MAVYVDIILTWVLFLALFPIAGFWLYRAYQIGVKKDYSVVAMKKGVPVPNPKKFVMPDLLLHAITGGLILYTIYGVLVVQWPYATWTALAGSTIWCKVLFSFVLGRHAHPPIPKKK